jgi:hypothetical protein
MQTPTISVLLVIALFAAFGALLALAASKSSHYLVFKVTRGLSRFGYFLASFLASLLPFLTGLLQPTHATEPVVAVGLIGSMIIAYYATRAQIQWHEARRSSED